jgi:hypothetical protein
MHACGFLVGAGVRVAGQAVGVELGRMGQVLRVGGASSSRSSTAVEEQVGGTGRTHQGAWMWAAGRAASSGTQRRT